MSQRLIKIILPEEQGKRAQDLLGNQEEIQYWQEEAADGQAVISVLTDSGRSERIMDLVEERFSTVTGFKVVLLPVEVALPRKDKGETEKAVVEMHPSRERRKTPLRISREEVYSDIEDSAVFNSVTLTLIILSTVVCAIGLVRNSVAVIIGAMVIAPLMGPNVALALSFTLADFKLGKETLKSLVLFILIAFFLSICIGYFFKTDLNIPEIVSRTHVSPYDLILALAAGCAGVLAFTTGLPTALIGVMVAVALLPPLTVCGLLLGNGQPALSFGACLLFMTNVICVNLSGVLTFLIQGIRPKTWWEAKKAQKAARIGVILWSLMFVILILVIVFAQHSK